MTRAGTPFVHHRALRGHWYAVACSGDVDPGPVGVRVLGDDVVVWRDDRGGVVAALDVCPHRQGPLSLGRVEGGCIECPYHGWVFDGRGRATLIPSSGAGAAVPARARLATVGACERYGLVWVCLDAAPSAIPTVEHDADPAFRRIGTEVQHWAASATRLVDNFLDVAHFPWVHAGTFGEAAERQLARVELEPLGDFFGYRYAVTAANDGAAVAASGQAGAVVARTMTTGFALPFTVRSTIAYETGLTHVILLVTTPVDDDSSLFTFVVWRNDDPSVAPEDVIRLDRAIGAEDKVMLERIPGPLPLEATALCNVPADRAGVEWRRRLRLLLGI